MKGPLSCTHLRFFLLEILLKLVQDLDGTIGVDSLVSGNIVGEHHPYVIKEGQALGSKNCGLNRVCCPVLKPWF
jgi:hypothetical protein